MEQKKDYFKLYLKYKKKYLNLKYKHNSSNFGGASLSSSLPPKYSTPSSNQILKFNNFFINIFNFINNESFIGKKDHDRLLSDVYLKLINSLDFENSPLLNPNGIVHKSIKLKFKKKTSPENIFSDHPLISFTKNEKSEFYSHNCLRVGDIINKNDVSVKNFPQLNEKFNFQKNKYQQLLEKNINVKFTVIALQECDFHLFNLIRNEKIIKENYDCYFVPRSIKIKLDKDYNLTATKPNPYVSQYGNVLIITKISEASSEIINNSESLTFTKYNKFSPVIQFQSRSLGVLIENKCYISLHLDIDEDKKNYFSNFTFLVQDIYNIFYKNQSLDSIYILGDFNNHYECKPFDIKNALEIFKKYEIDYKILEAGKIDFIIELTKSSTFSKSPEEIGPSKSTAEGSQCLAAEDLEDCDSYNFAPNKYKEIGPSKSTAEGSHGLAAEDLEDWDSYNFAPNKYKEIGPSKSTAESLAEDGGQTMMSGKVDEGLAEDGWQTQTKSNRKGSRAKNNSGAEESMSQKIKEIIRIYPFNEFKHKINHKSEKIEVAMNKLNSIKKNYCEIIDNKQIGKIYCGFPYSNIMKDYPAMLSKIKIVSIKKNLGNIYDTWGIKYNNIYYKKN